MSSNEISNNSSIKFYFREYKSKEFLEIDEDILYFNNDNWDDYFAYNTLYHLNLKLRNSSISIYIGPVKIYSTRNDTTDKVILFKTPLNNLDESFYSVGQTNDYYHRLKHYLGESKFFLFLKQIRDIAYDKSLRENLKGSTVYSQSLLRDSSARHAIDYFEINSLKYTNFSFKMKNSNNINLEINFDFSEISKDINIPSRINVIIGKNAVGKTFLLSNLAKVLSRKSINSDFIIEPSNTDIKNRLKPDEFLDYLLFSKYISISSNLYDNFGETEVPNKFLSLYDKISDLSFYIDNNILKVNKTKPNNIINLKNMLDEIEIRLKDKINLHNRGKRNNSYNYIGMRGYNTLMTDTYVFRSIYSALKDLYADSEYDFDFYYEKRLYSFKKIIKDLIFKDYPDNYHEEFILYIENLDYEISVLEGCKQIPFIWNKLSSGQKSLFFIFINLINCINENSLVIIDEPELHLHPNAISNFLKQLNLILDIFESFAIISTHSPLIVQETPSSKVNIFKTIDNYPFIDGINIETFGTNLNHIIKEIFDVHESESNYREVFTQLINNKFSIESIENMFSNNLSENTTSYLINKIVEMNND